MSSVPQPSVTDKPVLKAAGWIHTEDMGTKQPRLGHYF